MYIQCTICIEAAVHTIVIEADLSNSAAGVTHVRGGWTVCIAAILSLRLTPMQMRSTHDVMQLP